VSTSPGRGGAVPAPRPVAGACQGIEDAAAVASQARAGELIEIHGRFTATTQITATGSEASRAQTAGLRCMAAVRSFANGGAGFAYTTDVSSAGLQWAVAAARATRSSAQPPPPPGTKHVDDARWEDSSPALAQFEEAWTAPGPDSEVVLRRSRTSVLHVRSDGVHVGYTEGSTSAVVRRGPRAETAWSRDLRPSDLIELVERTAATDREQPWSLLRHPVVFLGGAGAAITAVIVRALVESPAPVAVDIAARLPSQFRILDDGADPDGPAGGPVDAEGWPTAQLVLAEGGELVIDPTAWGPPSKVSGPRGRAWRPDLARPPVRTPSNVALVADLTATEGEAEVRFEDIGRGLACDSLTFGALSFDAETAAFAVPCSGRLIRRGELTTRRVRGVLQGTVADLVAGILEVHPRSTFVPLVCGVRAVDVLVAHGVAMRSG